jgi:hypothetical protein
MGFGDSSDDDDFGGHIKSCVPAAKAKAKSDGGHV